MEFINDLIYIMHTALSTELDPKDIRTIGMRFTAFALGCYILWGLFLCTKAAYRYGYKQISSIHKEMSDKNIWEDFSSKHKDLINNMFFHYTMSIVSFLIAIMIWTIAMSVMLVLLIYIVRYIFIWMTFVPTLG